MNGLSEMIRYPYIRNGEINGLSELSYGPHIRRGKIKGLSVFFVSIYQVRGNE